MNLTEAPPRRPPTWTALLLWAAVLLPTTGCGPERGFSGIWQMAGCGARDTADCDDGAIYELHLGRYGDAVTGVVVRYQYQGEALDSFRRQNECGCAFIESGAATWGGLRFQVIEDHGGAAGDACHAREDACALLLFTLSGDDETLSGELRCGDGPPTTMRFVPVRGRPRTSCAR